jgi:hypothetical protein
MTIASRNKLYPALASLAVASVVLLAATFAKAAFSPRLDPLGEYSTMIDHADFGWVKVSSVPVAFVGTSVVCLGAAAALIVIARGFKRTVSLEIFFFAFWLASCSFEALRAVAYLVAVEGGSPVIVEGLTRALFFGRAFGAMALFVSSLYAAGFRNEKLGSALFVMFLLALGVATGTPINSGYYSPALFAEIGFGSLLIGAFGLLVLGTALDYVVAGFTKKENAYFEAAAAACAGIVGVTVACNAIHPIAGILALGAASWGSVRFLARMHSYYLWQ